MKNKRSAWLFALIFTLAACSDTPGDSNRAGDSVKTLKQLADLTTLSYQLVAPGGELTVGPNRLVFAVLDQQGELIRDGKFELFFARREIDVAKGPVPVTFQDDGLGDRSFYKAEVDFDDPGTWLILVNHRSGSKLLGAPTKAEVKATSSVPKIGDKATSIPTPTDSDHMGLADICSREPEDPMHELSLDAALGNSKPTVVTFSTPAFCASRVCGPVVDQVLRVRENYSDKANFIHVEVYKDLGASAVTNKEFTDAMKRWNLPSEPWTFIIDDSGLIQARFEGPVTTAELDSALKDLV